VANSEKANQRLHLLPQGKAKVKVKPLPPRLLRWLNWQVSRVTTDFGLADRWGVRIDGEELEGCHPLDEVAALQQADSGAHIEIKSLADAGEPESPWAEVYPHRGIHLAFRIVVWMFCTMLGACAGAYVFTGNSDSWAPKLPVAVAVGLGSAALAHMSLWWALGLYSSFCHFFLDHPRAFWRGTGPGVLGGVFLGCLAWHRYIGYGGGFRTFALGAAALLGTAGGVLFGYARAQSEHDQLQGGPCINPSVRRSGQVLTVLLLTVITVSIPATAVDTSADASWRAVLDYAHQYNLQFGTDLVFTYGPLGFLTTPSFSPHLVGLRMTTNVALSFVVCLGVSLVAWRLTLLWRCLLLVTFVDWSFPILASSPLGTDVMVQTGLLCWGMLCLAESGPGLRVYVWILVLLAIFAALTKTTFLSAAGLCLGIIACDCVVRGRRALAMMLTVVFSVGAALLWMALGQSLSRLPSFLAGAWTITKDYNLTMGSDPAAGVGVVGHGLLTILCGGAVVVLRSLTAFTAGGTAVQRRRGLVLAWSCALVFMLWKHGFVIADPWHEAVVLAVVPMLSLALGALPVENTRAGRWGRAMALLCCCYVFANPLTGFGRHGHFFSLDSLRFFVSWDPVHSCTRHMHTLLRPTEYWRELSEQELAASRRAKLTRLPQVVGAASVDVFGCNQAFALYNRLNYRPRPVFQSYVAYSAPLMRLNERSYLSPTTAPDYVLFRLVGSGYSKFPPLEDAFLLRLLLQNYEPIEAEGPFLLLKAKSTAPSELTLLREGTVRQGEPIKLEDFSGLDLWLEISLEPTLLGRVRQFLYKPPQVWLKVEGEGSEGRADKFWAPARMLEAGFLASPLVLDNLDVLHVYTGEAMVRPRAYSVAAGSPGRFYRNPFHFRIYKIENRLGRSTPQDLGRRLEPTVKGQLRLSPEGISGSG